MSAFDYKKIKGKYSGSLREPSEKPTVEQSVYAWALLNELIEIGYPHDFQNERADLRDFCYDISDLIKKTHKIKELTS